MKELTKQQKIECLDVAINYYEHIKKFENHKGICDFFYDCLDMPRVKRRKLFPELQAKIDSLDNYDEIGFKWNNDTEEGAKQRLDFLKNFKAEFEVERFEGLIVPNFVNDNINKLSLERSCAGLNIIDGCGYIDCEDCLLCEDHIETLKRYIESKQKNDCIFEFSFSEAKETGKELSDALNELNKTAKEFNERHTLKSKYCPNCETVKELQKKCDKKDKELNTIASCILAGEAVSKIADMLKDIPKYHKGTEEIIIKVPDNIEIYRRKNDLRLGIKISENKVLIADTNDFWLNHIANFDKVSCKLTPCKREDLKSGDVAFCTDFIDSDFTDRDDYCTIINTDDFAWIGLDGSINISECYFEYWYKVEEMEL